MSYSRWPSSNGKSPRRDLESWAESTKDRLQLVLGRFENRLASVSRSHRHLCVPLRVPNDFTRYTKAISGVSGLGRQIRMHLAACEPVYFFRGSSLACNQPEVPVPRLPSEEVRHA
eukprot:3782711-Pleurochrysis_carterae.AAC.1